MAKFPPVNASDQGLRFPERSLNGPHISECLVAEAHGQFVRLSGLAYLPKHVAIEKVAYILFHTLYCASRIEIWWRRQSPAIDGRVGIGQIGSHFQAMQLAAPFHASGNRAQ